MNNIARATAALRSHAVAENLILSRPQEDEGGKSLGSCTTEDIAAGRRIRRARIQRIRKGSAGQTALYFP